MNVDKLNLGILSTCLAVVPLLGVIALFFASTFSLDGVALIIVNTLILNGAFMITLTIGLISGILSFFGKPKSYVLPITGTLLNLAWIVFLMVAIVG